MGYSILVVDDNPVNLKLVCDVLESEGHTMRKASDASSAIEQLQQAIPDLILMDIGLPGMDGLTLTRKLKENEETRNIRIVALTAYAMRSDYEKAMDAGCDGFISKPVEIRKLPDQILQVLQKKCES